jgi:trans-2,3-dihydro-3-hydroxyanthranilate isomerase
VGGEWEAVVRKVKFIQADVFSDSPFGGNPVVVVPEPGAMTSDQMQRVARGMTIAETSFVVPPTLAEASFAMRCYTPTTEVVYSGHQLLGTAYVLAEDGRIALDGDETEVRVQLGETVRPVTLHAKDGRVTRVSTIARPAEFVRDVTPGRYGSLAAALSIDPMEVLHTGLPVQLVRTGLACLIVPVHSLHTVRSLMPVGQSLDDLLHDIGGECLLAFSRDTLAQGNNAHVRVFAPPLGVEEDPATGAANGALAAYLLRHGELSLDDQKQVRLRCEQGSEMGRPSLIEMLVDASVQPPSVRVGGRVARSLEGTVFY